MRLIDADKLIENMKGMNMLFSHKIVIDNTATAFDVDKCLEKLKEIEPYNWNDTVTEIAEHNMWEMCYNIVKECVKNDY